MGSAANKLFRLLHPEYMLAWQRSHKDKTRRYSAKYRASNRSSLRKYARDYAKEHVVEHTAYNKGWRKVNPEYQRNWITPEKRRFYRQQRRAAESRVPATLTPDDIREILSHPCFVCGATSHLTLAHNVAVSKGGGTTHENCACLCKSCNSTQGTRTFTEMGWLRLLKAA